MGVADVFRAEEDDLACRDRALVLITCSFGAAVALAAVLALLSVSVEMLPHVTAEEVDSFTVVVLPAGHAVLLGRSSGLDPAGALFVAPLFTVHPVDVEFRIVGNPLTGSFDAAIEVDLPHDPTAGC